MATKIFVNLPVNNLKKSMDFFSKLGFSFNPQFTDDKAACMVLSDDGYVMLVQNDFYRTFTQKQISDPQKSCEVILSISADSRSKVDEITNKASESGGKHYMQTRDYGWMYQRSFLDPDGHQWECIYMDMEQLPREMKERK